MIHENLILVCHEKADIANQNAVGEQPSNNIKK
jgi:hypothetical protein